MRRRTILATAGVFLSAGCSEILPEPRQTETDDGTTEASDTTDDTPPSETAPPGETPTERETERTDEPDETAQPRTEPPHPRTARHLDDARSHLGDALDQYAAAAEADDATLLDVTAETAITFTRITNPVSAARQELTDLPREATDAQRATATQLRAVGAFLASGARCQSALKDADDELDYITGRLYAERTGAIPSAIVDLRSFHSTARDHLDTLEAESDAGDTDAFDRLDTDTYTAKVEQLRREVTAFGSLPDTLSDLRTGFDAIARAANAYANNDYSTAREEFGTTIDSLGAAEDTLRSLDNPAAIADTVENLVADAASLSATAEDFRTAAADGARGVRPSREAVDAGQEHLRDASERVRDLSATEVLLRQ